MLSVMFRNLVRLCGLILLSAAFLVSGIGYVVSPLTASSYLEQRSITLLLERVGYEASKSDLDLIIRAAGGLQLTFIALMVLGVKRYLSSFFLALLHASMTLIVYMGYKQIGVGDERTSVDFLKSLSLIGALLFVSGSGTASKYQRATAQAAAKKHK